MKETQASGGCFSVNRIVITLVVISFLVIAFSLYVQDEGESGISQTLFNDLGAGDVPQEQANNDNATATTAGDKESNSTQESAVERWQEPSLPPQPQMRGAPICDFSKPEYDLCDMFGNASVVGNGPEPATVYFVPTDAEMATAEANNWTIRPLPRKGVSGTKEVIVKSLNLSSPEMPLPGCTVVSTIPAVIFSPFGDAPNMWHAFADILAPLWITSVGFTGDVQLIITGNEQWFSDKYRPIFQALSKHELVDLDKDRDMVRCYPHVIVGLRRHNEGINLDPLLDPQDPDGPNLREFVRRAYSLPKTEDSHYKESKFIEKPNLVLITRGKSRRFLNTLEIVAGIEAVGFQVAQIEFTRETDLSAVAKEVLDTADVLMGAHGAALTHQLFLRRGAVMVQVIPYGKMDQAAWGCYGKPANQTQIRHIDYSISPEESSLYDEYGKDDPLVSNPDEAYHKDWFGTVMTYWGKQDVKLNMTRFAPVLEEALRLLKE